MPSLGVQEVLSQLWQLTLPEQVELYRELTLWLSRMKDRVEQPTTLQEVRDTRFAGGLCCPRCGSRAVKRNGRFRDEHGYLKQRYYCRAGRRSFTDLTGTPLAYSKQQPLWGQMASCMVEGLSVRKTAQRLGVNRGTAFRWRHKLLQARHKLPQPELTGVVEADETYSRYGGEDNPASAAKQLLVESCSAIEVRPSGRTSQTA